MRTGKAKGTVFVHLREFVTRQHGMVAWDGVRGALPEDDRRTLDELVITGGWYPVAIWNRALTAYLPEHFDEADDGMRRLAGYIAENDLNKLYKMILSMGSPEFLLKRTGSLWSRYFDVGTLEATEIAPKRWHLTLTAPKESEAAPDYYTCECRFYAAPRCEYEVTW
jgi:hypothetical protein